MHDTRTDNRTRAGGVGKLCVNFPHTEGYKKSISHVGPFTWNALPKVVKENLYHETFKGNVKNYYWSMFQTRKRVR